jgi:hypothetical protein
MNAAWNFNLNQGFTEPSFRPADEATLFEEGVDYFFDEKWVPLGSIDD